VCGNKWDSECNHYKNEKTIKELPLEIGTTLYTIGYCCKGHCSYGCNDRQREETFNAECIKHCSILKLIYTVNDDPQITASELGKSLFTSMADALNFLEDKAKKNSGG